MSSSDNPFWTRESLFRTDPIRFEMQVTVEMVDEVQKTCKTNNDMFLYFHTRLPRELREFNYIHTVTTQDNYAKFGRSVLLELRPRESLLSLPDYLKMAQPAQSVTQDIRSLLNSAYNTTHWQQQLQASIEEELKRAMYEGDGQFLNPPEPIVMDKAEVWSAADYNFSTADMDPEAAAIETTNTLELEQMGFGKRRDKSNLPDDITDLDFSKLHTSQMWVLSDFLDCRTEVANAKQQVEQLKELKKACDANPDKAQYAYELVVLRKEPDTVNSKIDKATQEHYVALLCEILNKYSEKLDETAKASIGKIMAGVTKYANQLQDELKDFAKRAIVEAAEKRAPIIIKQGDKVRKIKGVLPPEFKRMVELASERIPIMLVGPSGCGKTYLSERLSEALDMDFSDQSCSEGMSEAVFNGRLLPIGANGTFQHVPSPFMDRYECGGVMLLDEIDAGDPNLFTYINKAVANSSYTVEQRYKKPRVEKHKDFVLIAAANTYGNGADAMYVGRNQLDAATLDRFKVGLITLDFNREVEESLAPQEVCRWAWHVRERITANKLRRIMSTRVIQNLGVMTERYDWKKDEWEKTYFTGWTEAERKLIGTTQ